VTAATTRGTARAFHVPELDGYRALAAVAVLVFHVATATKWNETATLAGLDIGAWVGRLGNYGVCVFFLLSGFLLYRPYVDAHLGGRRALGWWSFERKRMLRIFPLYWVVLTLALVFEATNVPPANAADGWWTYPVLYLLVQNYVDGMDSLGLPIAWTLCIEWSFYLALPGIAWAIRRLPGATSRHRSNRLGAQLSGLALLYLSAWAFRLYLVYNKPDWPGNPQNWLFNYFDWFSLGMLLAVAHAWRAAGGGLPRAVTVVADRPWLCWMFAIQLYWVGVMLHIPTDFVTPVEPEQTLARFLVNGTSAFLLLLPAILSTRRQPSTILATLRTRPLLWTGIISYGIYLWHKPVITIAKQQDPDPGFWPLLVLTTVVTFALSWLSHVVIEKPTMALKGPSRPTHRSRLLQRQVVWRSPGRRASTS